MDAGEQVVEKIYIPKELIDNALNELLNNQRVFSGAMKAIVERVGDEYLMGESEMVDDIIEIINDVSIKARSSQIVKLAVYMQTQKARLN